MSHLPIQHLKKLSPRSWSMRRQLLLGVLAFSLLLLVLLGIAAYQIASQETEEILDGQMQEMAYFLAKSPIEHLDSAYHPQHHYNETDVFIDIWTYSSVHGVAVASNQIRVPRMARAQFLQQSSPHGELKVYVLPLPQKQIQISQFMSVRRSLAEELAFNMMEPFILMVPLALLGLGLLISRTMRPLTELKRMISMRGHHDLTPIHINKSPSEVELVVDELNWLFQRIDQAQRQQQQFIADAAHELRTPLTALNLQLTVLQRLYTNHEHLESMKKGMARVQHLVVQMMKLAHQDAEESAAPIPVNLLEQTRFAFEQLMIAARQKNIDMGWVESPSAKAIFIHGNVSALQSVIFNIIDNAIKYTPVGGSVDISVKQDSQWAYLVVDDSGPGVEASQYQNIMERFVRLSQTQHEVMGSGLGLSIVQSALKQLGGKIHFAKAERLGGLSVSIQLPLA